MDQWSNLQSMCKTHHSQKTARVDGGFGNRKQGTRGIMGTMVKQSGTHVVIIYGPPGAGKTTYVKEHAHWGDLIVDWDALCSALSGLDWYEKPAPLLPFVASARDAVIDRLCLSNEVRHAWLITAEPKAEKLKALQIRLNAEMVFIDVSLHECLRHISADPRRNIRGWDQIVRDWFRNHNRIQMKSNNEDLPVFA